MLGWHTAQAMALGGPRSRLVSCCSPLHRCGRRSLQEASPGHLVGRKYFDKELGGGRKDVLLVLHTAGGDQQPAEYGVVAADPVEHADASGEGGTTEFVGGAEGGLTSLAQIAHEGCGVVLCQLVGGMAHRDAPFVAPETDGRCCRLPVKRSSKAKPSSRSSAVRRVSMCMPRRTVAKATSGLIPTTTVVAPRRPAISARLC